MTLPLCNLIAQIAPASSGSLTPVPRAMRFYRFGPPRTARPQNEGLPFLHSVQGHSPAPHDFQFHVLKPFRAVWQPTVWGHWTCRFRLRQEDGVVEAYGHRRRVDGVPVLVPQTC